MLLLNINRKACIGAITFDFGDIERSMPRSLKFRRLISCKGRELGLVLLLKPIGNHIWGVQQHHHISPWMTL